MNVQKSVILNKCKSIHLIGFVILVMLGLVIVDACDADNSKARQTMMDMLSAHDKSIKFHLKAGNAATTYSLLYKDSERKQCCFTDDQWTSISQASYVKDISGSASFYTPLNLMLLLESDIRRSCRDQEQCKKRVLVLPRVFWQLYFYSETYSDVNYRKVIVLNMRLLLASYFGAVEKYFDESQIAKLGYSKSSLLKNIDRLKKMSTLDK